MLVHYSAQIASHPQLPNLWRHNPPAARSTLPLQQPLPSGVWWSISTVATFPSALSTRKAFWCGKEASCASPFRPRAWHRLVELAGAVTKGSRCSFVRRVAFAIRLAERTHWSCSRVSPLAPGPNRMRNDARMLDFELRWRGCRPLGRRREPPPGPLQGQTACETMSSRLIQNLRLRSNLTPG
jgi:hypothetical protein